MAASHTATGTAQHMCKPSHWPERDGCNGCCANLEHASRRRQAQPLSLTGGRGSTAGSCRSAATSRPAVRMVRAACAQSRCCPAAIRDGMPCLGKDLWGAGEGRSYRPLRLAATPAPAAHACTADTSVTNCFLLPRASPLAVLL